MDPKNDFFMTMDCLYRLEAGLSSCVQQMVRLVATAKAPVVETASEEVVKVETALEEDIKVEDT
jgi:hypothetical protein